MLSGVAAVGLVALLIVLVSSLGSPQVAQHSDQSATRDAFGADSEIDPSQLIIANNVAENLAHIAGLGTYFEQELELRRVTGEADWKTLLEYLSQSTELESKRFRHFVQEVVVQCLANVNPTEAMERIYDVAPRPPVPDPNWDARTLASWRQIYLVPGRAEELIRIVYQEWAMGDLKQAVEHAKTLGELQIQAALNGIVDSRDDLARDELLEIARQLNIENSGSDFIAAVVAKETIADPDAAWQTFLESNRESLAVRVRGEGQTRLLESIARELLDKHGIDVIYTIDQQLPEDDRARSGILIRFIIQALSFDPEGAIQIATSLKPDQFGTIYGTPMLHWARSDPFAALDVALVQQDDAIRDDLLRGVHLSSRTWEDPQSLIEHIAAYPKERTASTFNRALSTLARQSPEIAATHISDVLEHREKLRIASEIVREWASRDVVSALAWVSESQDIQELKNPLLNVVLTELVYTDPQLALQTALEQPIGENNVGLESQVIQAIANFDLESAVALLTRSRNEQTKFDTALGLSAVMLESADSDGIFEVSDQLSAPRRAAFFESLLSTWTYHDPYGLYENINRLDSNELRSHAALSLLRESNLGRGIFSLSDEQHDEVTSYLTESQLTSLDEILDESARRYQNVRRTGFR
ncbi:MAG: hypothetical protein F4X44_04925 [Gammaproteobacteria bacterium]|nr:hypothetical protein [Gammaproteobacteria bacterium]MYD79934.1 hypothetical protein [Gammaproteobacteria bacterium]